MKKMIAMLAAAGLMVLAVNESFGQTNATDFTANDCSSVSHNLFTELNDGKVVVICWVMPCGNCINPALTISTAAKGYDSTNPGKVKYYVVDDYGNTNCNTLSTWVSTNGITADAIFSNSAVNMGDYGAAGMPKTVVLAGYNHQVFLNNNGALSETTLKTAINNALVTADTRSLITPASALDVFPNPMTGNILHFRCQLSQSGPVDIQITDLTGKVVKEVHLPQALAGDVETSLLLENIATGCYLVTLQTATEIHTSRLNVE